MTVFLCEDSVCGILTGVYDAWDSRLGHANVKLALKKGYQPELFIDCQEVDGMSSENYVRIIMAESLRFPEEGSSSQG